MVIRYDLGKRRECLDCFYGLSLRNIRGCNYGALEEKGWFGNGQKSFVKFSCWISRNEYFVDCGGGPELFYDTSFIPKNEMN